MDDMHQYKLAEKKMKKLNTVEKRWKCICCNLIKCDMERIKEPVNADEALSGEHAEDWYKAVKEEMNQIQRNNTWDIVNRPDNKRIESKCGF